MSDSAFDWQSSRESLEDDVSPDEPPQFGVVDMVEAFTAMRHEWRGQTKETRDLAEKVQSVVANLQEFEAKLLARAAEGSTDEARKLAELVADIDHQLTRAIAAVVQTERNRRLREESERKAVARYFEGMSALARWFARPLLTFLNELREAEDRTTEDPAVEGLNLVLARLRRMMKERGIERTDALGQAFDANTMNAIGTVETEDYPSGHVAEQLSPGYHWQGQLLRFADVRVAK